MDSMRGNYGSLAESAYGQSDDESAPPAPPAAIGQDERRMQVRAYNHWASLLEDRNFPAIEDLEPDQLPDFGPYSVLLDFSTGIENPGISYLGDKLARECDIGEEELTTLADVPSRSLLSRITDHYMQILANQAPIGFEAEFVNQRGTTIAYRGILLPFSSDDDTIDFIYGVINWKELADARAADELLLEIDQALEPKAKSPALEETPLTEWADGPGVELNVEAANDAIDLADDESPEPDFAADEFALSGFTGAGEEEDEGESEGTDIPVPSFGTDEEDDDQPVRGPSFGSLLRMPIQTSKAPIELSDDMLDPLAEGIDDGDDVFDTPLHAISPAAHDAAPYDEPMSEVPALVSASPLRDPGLAEQDVAGDMAMVHSIDLPELDPSEMELGDWLAAAREMALAARGNEERTRDALYEAVGRAYDFSLAAVDAPGEFEDILADSGLTMQDRAPMTPVVKLVFGADYDKTRLTEYAAVLSHAHRLELPRGALAEFLRDADGGLKGVVKAERRLRREEAGKVVEPVDAPRQALARKLRALPPQPLDAIASEGSEFALVMIHRTETGDVVSLGEVPEDVALVERAARRLLG